MALKDVIKNSRLKKNLKQEDAAKLAGVTVQTYSKWENGKTEPKASQVAVISQALGISTDAICNGKENQKIDMMEFIRRVSKLSKGVSDFDLSMAIWDSIDNDESFLRTLKDYNELPLETLED